MNSVERGGVGVRHQVVSSIYAGGMGKRGIMRGRGQRDRGAGGSVVKTSQLTTIHSRDWLEGGKGASDGHSPTRGEARVLVP